MSPTCSLQPVSIPGSPANAGRPALSRDQLLAGRGARGDPGHGKTIAASYIVGARGRPVDALVLGIFVTLSHTSGIILVAALATLGSAWLIPQRVEAYLAVGTGLLVIGIGGWMLWTQIQQMMVGRALGHAARGYPTRRATRRLTQMAPTATIIRTITGTIIRMPTARTIIATDGGPSTPTTSRRSPTPGRGSASCSAWALRVDCCRTRPPSPSCSRRLPAGS